MKYRIYVAAESDPVLGREGKFEAGINWETDLFNFFQAFLKDYYEEFPDEIPFKDDGPDETYNVTIE